MIILICFPLYSQDEFQIEAESKLNQWYQLQSKSVSYQSLYTEFLEEIKTLLEKGITTDYFFEKLNQGLSKSVSPEKLLIAIKEDVQRLVQAKGIIQKLGIPEGRPINQANIKSLSIYIQAGLNMDFFDMILKDYPPYLANPDDPDQFTTRINQFLLLCEAMAKINSASQINNDQLTRLSLALVNNPMQPQAYETLVSIYTRAKLNHLGDTIIISTMIEILQNKGGIIEITDQLNRRMKYR